MQNASFVHLATHGESDGVHFARATNDIGLLRMDQVQVLDLSKCHLVVLSQCNSLMGELRLEGMVGIARAFAGPGFPSLVVSLWSVRDTHALELMD